MPQFCDVATLLDQILINVYINAVNPTCSYLKEYRFSLVHRGNRTHPALDCRLLELDSNHVALCACATARPLAHVINFDSISSPLIEHHVCPLCLMLVYRLEPAGDVPDGNK